MSERDRTGLRASLLSLACFLKGMPLFFRASPKTPLRVLAIVAIDTLHMLRHSKPLTRKKVRELAMLLDFQACTNAAWDRKERCKAEHRAIREHLEKAGLRLCIEEYLGRLHELESGRPSPGGDRRRFGEVRSYREAVVRLSLATAIAMDARRLDEEIRATHDDGDVATLFRIVMQCQVIDDVIDYTEDVSASLPSFLTATASLPQALELTADAARDYAASEHSPSAVFPLRVADTVCAAMATLIVRLAHRWHRSGRREMVKGSPDVRPDLLRARGGVDVRVLPHREMEPSPEGGKASARANGRSGNARLVVRARSDAAL